MNTEQFNELIETLFGDLLKQFDYGDEFALWATAVCAFVKIQREVRDSIKSRI